MPFVTRPEGCDRHVRIGFGRKTLAEVLQRLADYLPRLPE
jgi:hypothetical protein